MTVGHVTAAVVVDHVTAAVVAAADGDHVTADDLCMPAADVSHGHYEHFAAVVAVAEPTAVGFLPAAASWPDSECRMRGLFLFLKYQINY